MNYQKSNEWYTPSCYIEAARLVMDGIELDPASTELANQTVKAERYYTAKQDGLRQDWSCRSLWLNPPYSSLWHQAGRTGNARGLMQYFVQKLLHEYRYGRVKQAILCTVTDTDTSWFAPLWDFLICFTAKRVRFTRPGLPNASQFFGTAFVYLGPNTDRFTQNFSQFGPIVCRISLPLQQEQILRESV